MLDITITDNDNKESINNKARKEAKRKCWKADKKYNLIIYITSYRKNDKDIDFDELENKIIRGIFKTVFKERKQIIGIVTKQMRFDYNFTNIKVYGVN